jgi:predicted transcriptional regulator
MADTIDASNVVDFMAALNKGEKTKLKQRYSGDVIERGYTLVPTILLWGQAKLGLEANELNVLLQIMSHWFFADNEPHPSKEKIAKRMGRHPRRVQAYLTSLENKGFIARRARYRASGGQDTNGYDLSGLLQKLKVLAPEFKKASEQNKIRRGKVEAPAG